MVLNSQERQREQFLSAMVMVMGTRMQCLSARSGSQLSRTAEGAILVGDGDGDGDEDAMFIRSFWFSTNGGGRPSSFSFSTNGGGDGDGGEDGLSVLVLNERRREAR